MPRREYWSNETITEERNSIRARLDKWPAGDSHRLNWILAEIDARKKDASEKSRLQLLLLVVFALSHHLRWKGLSDRELDELAQIGQYILKLKGIEPGRSRLSFLHADLHMMLSQIYARTGANWKAAWEQALATRRSAKAEIQGVSRLVMSDRLFRLGHLRAAIIGFEEAIQLGLSVDLRSQTKLKIAQCRRLRGEWDHAISICDELIRLSEVKEEFRTEAKWEALSVEVQKKMDARFLIEALRKKPRLFKLPEYIFETYLWCCVVESTQWIRKYPNLPALAKGLNIKVRVKTPLSRATAALETALDGTQSFDSRLRELGETLSQSSQLSNIGQEALLWGASLKWLVRNPSDEMKIVTESEYRALCLRISEGARNDIFKLL